MIVNPASPVPNWAHILFWICLGVAMANLIFSKLCLWKAAWHLRECHKLHREGDKILDQLKRFSAVSYPPKESCHASPANEDR